MTGNDADDNENYYYDGQEDRDEVDFETIRTGRNTD